MRRYLYFTSPLLVIISVSYAMAQTLTTDAPVPEKAWEIILKLGFPILMTAAGPYITGLITSNFVKVHPAIQYAITSFFSLITGALVGQIPDFPLTSESAATMAIAAGNTGQFMANSHKDDFHPKTEAAKAEAATLPKAKGD